MILILWNLKVVLDLKKKNNLKIYLEKQAPSL